MLSNKTDEWKQIESMFPQNQINDLILNRIKEIKQLQDNINLDDLEYTSKMETVTTSVNIFYMFFFKRYNRNFITRRCW